MKHIFTFAAIAFSLTGCELYFGGDHGGDNGDRWTYCANDGYYVCAGENCEWAGPRCPDDPNYTCESSADCAAGCYCANGVCEEAGFCSTDAQCPDGYHCDEGRSSCEPDGCTTDADCDAGQYCDPATQSCTASCTCTNDTEAQNQGWGYCDETRGTCEPPSADGSCVGTITCNQIPTTCPVGQVPLIENGCYTGNCRNVGMCDIAPTCGSLQHEGDCLNRAADCTSVYTGLNCTNSSGATCTAGSTGCTCESFEYATCRTKTASAPAMSYLLDNGQMVNVFSIN